MGGVDGVVKRAITRLPGAVSQRVFFALLIFVNYEKNLYLICGMIVFHKKILWSYSSFKINEFVFYLIKKMRSSSIV